MSGFQRLVMWGGLMPGPFADCADGPRKQFLMEHRDDPTIKPYFDLAFAKRPAEELYDLTKDPGQLENVADDPRMFGRGHELEPFP